MSGLEIAGIVLGALPLVIAALQYYAEGISTGKRWLRYRTGLRSLIDLINTEKTIFSNTTEQLLTGLGGNEMEAELLAQPGGELWKDLGVESKLKRRLGNAYDIYFTNVKGMMLALEAMKTKLALSPDGKPQFNDLGLFKHEYQRLRFSINKTEYNQQTGELQYHNQALARLTEQSVQLESTRTNYPKFKLFQNCARNLFETLRSGLCCNCNNHAVKLRLESRSSKVDEEIDMLEHTPFRVIFTCAVNRNASLASPPPWDWTEADVRYIIEDSKPLLNPVTGGCAGSVSKSKQKLRVRFGGSGNSPDTCTKLGTVTNIGLRSGPPTQPPAKHIQDLCQAIARLPDPQQVPCIGYLVDSKNRRHGVYPLNAQLVRLKQRWKAYSLGEMLANRTSIGDGLTPLHRHQVAVALASSVLQLYKTPWLDENWSHNDIFFVHNASVPMDTTYEHPFVWRKIASTPSTSPVLGQPSRIIRNQTLYALGILLIELLYGKPIDQLKTAADIDCDGTPGVAWCTAVRLVDEEMFSLVGLRYCEVVRRCIRCDFDAPTPTLDNEDFQRAVFDGVVAPLELNLRHFTGL